MKVEVKPLGMIIGSIKGVYPKLMADIFRQKEIEYSFDQMVVLMVVKYCQKDAPVQQDIAEIMMKDKSVVLRMIDVLEKDQLLVRSTDPNDRRRNIITLTENGLEYTELFNACDHEMTVNLMDGLSEEEIATFYKVFDHIQNKIGIK